MARESPFSWINYPESKAIQAYSKVIFFRWLNLERLAGYLTQELDKLKLLGFEENSFGSALVVDWDEIEKKTPNQIFYFELLSLSWAYDEIEIHNSIVLKDELEDHFLYYEHEKIHLPSELEVFIDNYESRKRQSKA